MKEESTLPKSTSPLTSPNSEEGCRALPTTALPPMLDTTPVPPPIRKDSVSDGKNTSTFKPIGSMSILDVKYFPKASYQYTTTTTLSERQREILGSVKGKGLSEIRRKSIDDDLVKPETPDHSCSTESRRYAKCRRLHLRLRNPPSRTLSPVLGAMHIEPPTLDYTHLPEIVFREAIPSIILPQHIAAWVTMFFKEPLTYHAYHYCQGMWLERIYGRPMKQGTLQHKAELLRLMVEYIDNFENANLELLLMGIVTIFQVSTEDGSTSLSVPELFTPHPAPDELRKILNRVETLVSHAKALNWLLDKRGPDTPFQHFPGLEVSLPLVDVIISSAHATKPRHQHHNYSTYYAHSPNRLSQCQFPASPYAEGIGFATSMSGTLPPQAITAYRNLALLDRVCASTSIPGSAHFKYFSIDPRVNAVQHQVLSVPQWDDLTEYYKARCSRVVYESCRIACILYSNSVMCPIPTTVGSWWSDLLRDLKHLLASSGVPKKEHVAVPMAVWVSFVGSMCAYGHESYGFFLACLRRLLAVADMTKWEDVSEILDRFLWNDQACARGAKVIWRELGMERE